MAFRFEDENEDDIGLAVVLSIWLGLFWLVAIVGVHLIFEWIRQAHPEACGARALARAIWEIKLDLALVLFAFALALYLEVIAGTPRFHAGALENVNDGSLGTRVDTWYGGDAQINSYVGIVWNRTRFDFIETLSLTLATFRDGGWFGQSGLSPAPGEPLVAAVHLIEPTVQVSTDGGMSWTGVTHTSNYLTVLDGHRIGGEAHPNPTAATVLFTLNPLVTQINGIRIIGENGGITSSDANGFLGVYELWVDAHPPLDSDADGLPDAWEELHGLSVGENDAEADPDLDELSNQAEFAAGTHPQVADTDADGLSDGAEVKVHGTHPRLADTDGDGLTDGEEIHSIGTDPLVADTDGDGLSDGAEVNVHRCDPTKVDSDHDGFNDALEVAAGSDPNSAMSAPANVALIGTAIIGTKESLATGVEVPWANAGVPENINDGDLLTRVDTWNGGNTATMSYVGILWDKPLARAVTRVQLSLAIFSDGGWFGVNGSGPGAGGVLLAAVHLEQPELQITRTGGTEWDSVGSVSADYTIALNGHPLPAVEHGPPTTATAIIELWEPATGINGIRLIGPEGGTASNGFLGVFELVVEALPPSAVEPVTLVVPRRDGPRFGFEFASQLGVAHVVWSKAHLEEEWQIHSTLPGDGMIQTVWDAWTGAQRFYQVTSE